eukprot:scaffold367_cov202-Alexandrium_tamarense.AAC.29
MSTDRTTINSFAVCNADMGNDVLDDNNNSSSSSNEQRTQHDDNDRGDDIIINDAPFEWLTNFQSLMHLVSPSRIVFGESSLDSSTSLKNGITSKLYSHQHHPSLSTSNGIINLNALHVGCGTSTCGEEMLDIQECIATNTSDSVSSNNNMNNKADVQQRREVVYHLQYGHVILTQLPGAEWDVVHEVVKRRVGSIGKAGKDGGVIDNEAVDGNNDHDGSNLHVEEVVATKSHFAWSSGTFQPDDNYRKTVNVFTCRRKHNTPTSPYILDRELVRRYIEKYWEAYCERRESQKDALSREGMTVDIALDFLREMQ